MSLRGNCSSGPLVGSLRDLDHWPRPGELGRFDGGLVENGGQDHRVGGHGSSPVSPWSAGFRGVSRESPGGPYLVRGFFTLFGLVVVIKTEVPPPGV